MHAVHVESCISHASESERQSSREARGEREALGTLGTRRLALLLRLQLQFQGLPPQLRSLAEEREKEGEARRSLAVKCQRSEM